MQKLLFQFTGGTISMKIDPSSGGAIPVMDGGQILEYAPELRRVCEVVVHDFSMLPGPHMTPQRMLQLAQSLDQQLAHPEIAAAVVTHGTDTIEETAFFLDLALTTDKPVILTGSMRNSSELSWDGPANLLSSAYVALHPEARGQGVLVVLAQEAHRAREVRKSDTHAIDTFVSPRAGAAALIDGDQVLWLSKMQQRLRLPLKSLEDRVAIIPAYTGADGSFIDFAVANGARGLVIEGTGRGNVPPPMVGAIQKATENGVAVVISTRCWEGRVLPSYAYPGSGGDLAKYGVYFSYRLPSNKARLLLMALLSRGANNDEIRAAFL
jgi:L-asparaginase